MPNDANQGKPGLDFEKPKLEISIYDRIFWKARRYDEMPEELRGFNWGAFLLTFIWGIYHGAYWTLATPIYILVWRVVSGAIDILSYGSPHPQFRPVMLLMPIGALTIRIIYGFNGNRWAWQSGHYVDARHFRKMQRLWAIIGVILIVGFVTVYLAVRIFINWKINQIMNR